MDILHVWIGTQFLKDVEEVLSFLSGKNASDDVDGPHLEVIQAHIYIDYTMVQKFFKPFPVTSLNFFEHQSSFFLENLTLEFNFLRVLGINPGVILTILQL